jgi:hypothetical protein
MFIKTAHEPPKVLEMAEVVRRTIFGGDFHKGDGV